MSIIYTLPYRERIRVSMRARAIREHGGGFEVSGVLISDREGRLELWFLDHQEVSEQDLTAVWRSIRPHDKWVVGTFRSGSIKEPGADVSDLSQDNLQLVFDIRTQNAHLWRISGTGGRRVVSELPLVAEHVPSEGVHGDYGRDWRFGA